ncbi:MAG: hypothetical protein JWM48_3125 [Mycobacterium sp.]|jgi:hypothetical protein|nr:hypothetical protein [Mycobacterium sp.]MCW2746575.1 hypothetical protein [Mycobacterium sp.]
MTTVPPGPAGTPEPPAQQAAPGTPGSSPEVTLRRTDGQWHVVPAPGGELDGDTDLIVALTLADLVAGPPRPAAAPGRADPSASELERLRVQVRQLEHALAARVLVEQAIGVLAERLGAPPRTAFEQLRRIARSRGQKVFDLATAVVASAHGAPAGDLPVELRPPQH